MRPLLYKIFQIIKKIFLIGLIASIGSVILFRFVPIPVTPLMLIRLGEQAYEGKPLKLYKEWKSLDEMSPNMVWAVIASEDQRFTEHWGFDLEAIQKVMKSNKKNKIRGASTISQQTAKNVFLWPGRSWLRKGLEVYFTSLIEIFWSKERIMEVYLNVIEMGEGVYGTEAAAHTYFKCSAKNLRKDQAALIAATLPNPRRWSPAKPTAYINAKKSWILRNIPRLKRHIQLW